MKKLQYSSNFNLYNSSISPHVNFDKISSKKSFYGKQNKDRKALFLTATSVKNQNLNSQSKNDQGSMAKTFQKTKFSSFYRSKSQHNIQFRASQGSTFYPQNRRAHSISKQIKKRLQINVDPYSRTHHEYSHGPYQVQSQEQVGEDEGVEEVELSCSQSTEKVQKSTHHHRFHSLTLKDWRVNRARLKTGAGLENVSSAKNLFLERNSNPGVNKFKNNLMPNKAK